MSLRMAPLKRKDPPLKRYKQLNCKKNSLQKINNPDIWTEKEGNCSDSPGYMAQERR